ncbi:MAG: EamA family transporter RarD [Treponema sp.]|nr:EamA family transporter RarD [Treponema sp.]
MKNPSFAKGIFFAVSAYFIWGISPLYWNLLGAIDSFHLLALRIILSMTVLGGILTLGKNFAWLTFFKDREKRPGIIVAASILGINWGVYLWAFTQGRIIEASLGYYINPLISIVLGLFFFKEKLSVLQWMAFSLACLGVLILTVFSGVFPWISVALALCFGFYGLIKKKLKLPPLESLTSETLLLVPVGFFLLFVNVDAGAAGINLLPTTENFSHILSLGVAVLVPLAFCGVFSALPLYFFGSSVRVLPLSTLGFLQFVSPTMMFFIGLFVFEEVFPMHHFIAFAVIWLAVILYIISIKQKQAQG